MRAEYYFLIGTCTFRNDAAKEHILRVWIKALTDQRLSLREVAQHLLGGCQILRVCPARYSED
jgi:hypothetical protein